MPEDITQWIKSRPQWVLAILTVCVLLPFIGKPFNMDDPLFIWAAHQIRAHPADPYGFNVEWNWRQDPMWKVTENPPLTSYYIALASVVVGWSETALHFAFMLPVLAVTLGTFRLARHFCKSPLLAGLVTLFTPAFLVSSTTLMCDVPMLAFWVWTVIFWVEGTEQNLSLKLFAAGCLAAFALLTKYYGVCLVPLLAVYSILSKRRLGQWAQFLLIPLAALCAYQVVMEKLYGLYPLANGWGYSFTRESSRFSHVNLFLMGLAFTGGCLAPALFFAPMLWKKWLAAFAGVGILVACLLVFDPVFLKTYASLQGPVATEIQLALWAATGVSILALAIVEIGTSRDAKSFLLVLWMMGTFIFAVFLNWTINARSILPMAPALGILIARRLERNYSAAVPIPKTALCMAASAAIAIYVTEADCLTAVAIRQNVRSIYAAYGRNIERIHFQGHWGFQYYMSQLGALPLDFKDDMLRPGDLVAVPSNNYDVLPPAAGKGVLVEVYSESGPPCMATVSAALGASFYASILGPLPFAFGPVPDERVYIYSLR